MDDHQHDELDSCVPEVDSLDHILESVPVSGYMHEPLAAPSHTNLSQNSDDGETASSCSSSLEDETADDDMATTFTCSTDFTSDTDAMGYPDPSSDSTVPKWYVAKLT